MSKFNISINGRSMNITGGKDIYINNGDVIIDGKRVDIDEYVGDSKTISISVQGNVESISGTAANITVEGNANTVKSQSGDVTVHGSVSKSVSTMSGDATVLGDVGGSVSTMSGDINR